VALRRAHKDERRADHAGGARVVVIDDDAAACELLVRVLRAAPPGYQVERARDQIDLTERLMSSPPVAAIVVDVSAGGIGGGLKLLDAVRGSLDPVIASTPVVLVAPSASSAMFSWQAGVDELLVRPFHAKELVEAVGTAIARPADERPRYRRRQLDAAKAARAGGSGMSGLLRS
jgi:DNA-binding response OmpR family regulator